MTKTRRFSSWLKFQRGLDLAASIPLLCELDKALGPSATPSSHDKNGRLSSCHQGPRGLAAAQVLWAEEGGQHEVAPRGEVFFVQYPQDCSQGGAYLLPGSLLFYGTFILAVV